MHLDQTYVLCTDFPVLEEKPTRSELVEAKQSNKLSLLEKPIIQIARFWRYSHGVSKNSDQLSTNSDIS
ncbi:hypothetical protein PanWU01x14_257510 [Parasponia andersonii]|uniref:Uncharacterized protein n=1 Tax=Parasponia andersonii TaxID=3476 RepID=A0A2P5BA25_PARAD|nr:hypothetical protein PanWU01x14_257510 [Parasponia andersonii]